jgi:IclR family KDG regulon transcriptional repressor
MPAALLTPDVTWVMILDVPPHEPEFTYMNQTPPPVVKSAARAIDVLELLVDRPEGLTLLEIAEELDLAKSSAHGLVATLLGRSVLRLTQDGRRSVYRLGHRIFEIGQAYAQTTDLLRDGQQVVQGLSISCGETAHLAVLDGNFVVYLAKHEGIHAIRMVSAVGKRFSAHGTGVGKVLLAGLEDAEVERRFGAPGAMPPLTPHTVTDLERLLKDLADVRATAIAHEHEESTEGVGCVAAPVYDATGMVAAISVSVPVGRFPEERQAEFARHVHEAAVSLSVRLGAGVYPDHIAPGTTRDLT